jgi:hypothetical protein
MSNPTTTTTTPDATLDAITNNNNNNNNGSVDGGMHAVAQTSNAILARLKEVEGNNSNMASMVEKLKQELQSRDDKIKDLSADKRKDMELMIDNAIEKWLSSLTDVPAEVKQQFKTGICKIAEQADTKNAAWEIVCNASTAHATNVRKIDELIKTCSEQGETIKTLMTTTDPAFNSESSRVSGVKRTRASDSAPLASTSASLMMDPATSSLSGIETRSSDAWNDFQSMMKLEMSAKYF